MGIIRFYRRDLTTFLNPLPSPQLDNITAVHLFRTASKPFMYTYISNVCFFFVVGVYRFFSTLWQDIKLSTRKDFVTQVIYSMTNDLIFFYIYISYLWRYANKVMTCSHSKMTKWTHSTRGIYLAHSIHVDIESINCIAQGPVLIWQLISIALYSNTKKDMNKWMRLVRRWR